MRQIAVVTGAAQGIGLAIAQMLANRGVEVFGIDQQEKPRAFPQQGGGFVVADLSEERDLVRLAHELDDSVSKLHYLVNAAGVLSCGPDRRLESQSLQEWNKIFAIHCHAPFFLTKFFWDKLAAAEGAAVLNISSDQSINPKPDFMAYGASKAALNHLTRSFAKRGKDLGIRVNAIAYGPVRTGFLKSLSESDAEAMAMWDAVEREAPLGVAEVHEAAQLAITLLTDLGRRVSGQIWCADSGMSL